MKKIIILLLLGGVSILGGCVSQQSLDEMPPMPAADPSVDDVNLANGMDEPAPESNDSPTQNAPTEDLWVRMRQGFALDLSVQNDRIRIQRDWYARHPQYFMRVTTRAERYLDYIVDQAQERNMPLELALLPMVESAFDPFAYSHGRASGPWQFIPSTGDHFGMKRTWWQDQRRDIIQSTNSALTYLQQLSERFDGDWLLALAAYNAGGGTVSRAIRRNEEAGRPTDFWHLDLPRETSAYVPKLLAIAQIVANPADYNVALHPIPNQPYFATVNTGGQIDLAQAAKLASISVEELYLLNPSFNRWATSPDGPHRLLVPVDKADGFRTRLASLPKDQRMQWARYQIRPGDSLIAIARQYRTTPQVLRSINHLNGNTIIAGRTLLIPGPSASGNSYTLSESQRLAQTQARGSEGRQRVNYTVRSGDTLWDIARRNNVKVSQLAKWNNMAPRDSLHIGQSLAIWTHGTQVASNNADNPNMIRKVHYAVRNGDSLYAIADRFNVSVNDITNWNDSVSRKRYLQPGQRLTLYVDIRQTN
ncbi:membrane-bound lytic murein transglycosylase D [Alcanivorax hongdengensis A-11-3]|uniref:Membrane-bound lytic murein transglycosylase D n=1 Tax=Alcanivorax hongdengensis A-11-3 TaxID=1177179 RepID=L0WDX0_9GAMM|nr:LysM peptidoglycan-binding domain-containing protein [Alcanivorax hongdengensis]EKF74899.1 membrane-bound lytic murein transglycosylase D [Alcanivorax hongdengensis A-11-3]